MPWLAALVCCLGLRPGAARRLRALHDAPFTRPITLEFMNADLAHLPRAAPGQRRLSPARFPTIPVSCPRPTLPAWHLVGGNDPIDASELTGDEPDDGYPVLLRDWIRRDGLTCLKSNSAGMTGTGTMQRLAEGRADRALRKRRSWLSADFNCTVSRPRVL